MSSDKLEYDSTVGGNVHIPEALPTFRFAADRLKEMNSIIEAVTNPSQTKLVFQTLPKHMRRRTMTHNAKRLPRKFRSAHTAQMLKSGLPQKEKRPSRKYRRKPSNLMKEYKRRQMKNIWLETHIWHAKRFHMTERWGYKLPLAPCDKSFRACYRATSKHCLIQDVSFIGCMEISGPLDVLRDSFQKITSSKCGLGITAKAYLDGRREGSVDVFRKNSYPNNIIGKINFLWKPIEDENSQNRVLWIFAHASFYKELVNEMILLFDLENGLKNNPNGMEIDDEVEKLKIITKNGNSIRTPKYVNKKMKINLIELKDTMNRFRLTGPLSQAILSKAFKLKSEENEKSKDFWNKIKNINSPAELPPNMILGLIIEDPRLNRPTQRTKAIPEEESNESFLELPNNLGSSPIWDSEIRDNLSKNMMSTDKFCKLRNKHGLIPGERCSFENDMQSVPVLLIQRPGSQETEFKKLGYNSGWDVIIPSGYGVATWLCLVMWGARAGGLREMRSMCREGGFDEFLPDTVSGKLESELKMKENRSKFFRLPPNKRCSYSKFAIASPFKCPFPQLVKEWSDNKTDFYVLREKELLEKIQSVLAGKLNLNSIKIPENCLIPVYIAMKTRGNIEDNSIICLPKKEDLRRNFKKKQNLENDPVHTEPLRTDKNENDRKALRTQHLRLLKRMRNRRIRAKRKKQETSERGVRISKPGTEQIISEQFKKMCELWLPDSSKSIRNQCSREVFGYVTQGDFSFTEGKVAGVGYMTAKGLEKLIKVSGKGKIFILVRATNTRNYRIATFKVKL